MAKWDSYTIKELQDRVEQDGLGITVHYGINPEHIQDDELKDLWTVAQNYLERIQSYLDERDRE